MILCCGECLIDFVPRETREGALAYQPMNGGSIYNTAIALGRLGLKPGFFGGLSTDFFGDQLREGFAASGVDCRLSLTSDRYTVLAFVKLSDGQARYNFIDEGSASRSITVRDLPRLGSRIDAIHVGSIAMAPEPCGSAYEALAALESPNRVVSYDPNVRPSLVKDRVGFIARANRVAAHADLIKLSDEDLRWFDPNIEAEEFAQAWLRLGAKVVTITRGPEGAVAFTAAHRVEIPGVAVKVADTIGAGDTFTAGILAYLGGKKLLTKPAIAQLSAEDLRGALSYAARAAAVTVSRPGADPPWAREMAEA